MTVLEKLVVEEAKKLKEFATKEELDKLNYDELEGESKSCCIYGQMTGTCTSTRANDLIQKCCERVYKPSKSNWDSRNLAGRLNGKPKALKSYENRLSHYVSPIENFLYKNKREEGDKCKKVEKLVQFLKGEIDVLNFDKI